MKWRGKFSGNEMLKKYDSNTAWRRVCWVIIHLIPSASIGLDEYSPQRLSFERSLRSKAAGMSKEWDERNKSRLYIASSCCWRRCRSLKAGFKKYGNPRTPRAGCWCCSSLCSYHYQVFLVKSCYSSRKRIMYQDGSDQGAALSDSSMLHLSCRDKRPLIRKILQRFQFQNVKWYPANNTSTLQSWRLIHPEPTHPLPKFISSKALIPSGDNLLAHMAVLGGDRCGNVGFPGWHRYGRRGAHSTQISPPSDQWIGPLGWSWNDDKFSRDLETTVAIQARACWDWCLSRWSALGNHFGRKW